MNGLKWLLILGQATAHSENYELKTHSNHNVISEKETMEHANHNQSIDSTIGRLQSISLPVMLEFSSPKHETVGKTDRVFTIKATQTLGASSNAGSLVTVITIGSQKFRLLLDTGSALTWVRSFDSSKSPTYSPIPNTLKSFLYADGSTISCNLHTDIFTFGTSLSLSNQFCQASSVSGTVTSTGFDGIMGIGPSSSVFASLASADYNSISFWFNTTNAYPFGQTTGEVVLGDVNIAQYTGQLLPIPIAKTQMARWQVSGEGVTTNDGKVVYEFRAGTELLIDTGATFVSLPQEAVEAINVGVFRCQKNGDGTYTLACNSISSFGPLSFFIGGSKIPISIPSQLLFIPIPNSRTICRSIIQSADLVHGQVLVGVLFLQNFFLSYDYTKSVIYFGVSAQQNGQLVGSVGVGPSRPTSLDQVAQINAIITSKSSNSDTSIASSKLFWIILASCAALLLFSIAVLFYFLWRYPIFRNSVVHTLYLIAPSKKSPKEVVDPSTAIQTDKLSKETAAAPFVVDTHQTQPIQFKNVPQTSFHHLNISNGSLPLSQIPKHEVVLTMNEESVSVISTSHELNMNQDHGPGIGSDQEDTIYPYDSLFRTYLSE